MPYRLVKGEFHLFYKGGRHVGSLPDGDSVWSKPDDPKHLDDFHNRSANFNGGGFGQLRFEAIDALELHYKGAEQSHDPATAARNFTFETSLGFATVDCLSSPETRIGLTEAPRFRRSTVYAALAESGNAYPAFCTRLPLDLRRRVMQLTKKASANGIGLLV